AVYMTTTAGITDTTVVDSVAFLVSPWGPDATGALKREFLALQMNVPADGKWHTMRYDISQQMGKPDFNGTILENDFTEIQAVLVENVVWPGRFAFTMDMDNFKIGDAAAPNAPVQNKQMNDVRNKFWVEYKVTPSHDGIIGYTGLSKDQANTSGDLAAVVRFNESGKIDALNADTYTAATDMSYQNGVTYTIEIIGDVATQKYNVRVREGENAWVEIGSDLGFNNTSVQDQLNYFNMVMNEDDAQGGISGSRLDPSFAVGDYVLGYHNLHGSDLAMNGTHRVLCNATPTADRINAGYSLSNGNPTVPLAWGEYSTIVRFNTDGLIDVRDGNTYNADANMTYSAGVKYFIEMTVDVPNKKYSVTITPEGGSAVNLASDYDFRVAADDLNFASKTLLTGTAFGGAQGDLVITDFEVITSTLDILNDVNIIVSPNPSSDFLKFTSPEVMDVIEIYSLSGQILQSYTVGSNKFVMDARSLGTNAAVALIHMGSKTAVRKLIFQ
ncbi:MAG: hypothetical protein KDC04_06930, partial [Saprospiraceae bacterium]|nr:hypothetical protein [Saprospiraceae bacterium]